MRALLGRDGVRAAVILGVLSLGFVSPGLMPGKTLSNGDSFWFQPPWVGVKSDALERPANPEVDDAPAVLQPFLRYAKQRLPDIPLWNPHITSGRTFLADAQSAIFSPFNVVAYVLPVLTALGLIAALKLFVASFGLYLLARRLALGFWPAVLGGVVYGFNLWLVTWLPYPHASVWALIPLMLVAADGLARRPGPLPAAGLASVTAAQFLGGHPESSFHALLATVAFWALRAWPHRREQPVRRIALLGGALAGGGLLAALVIFPFFEVLLRSADLEQRSGASVDEYLPRNYLLGAFLPDFWGKPTQTPITLFLLARAVYAGALPLMLAGIALLGRPRGPRLWVAGFGAGCIAVVFGIPPLLQIVTRIPPFSSGHNGRLIALAMLCVALLAAWGLDDVLRRRAWVPRAKVLLPIAGALVLAPVVAVVIAGRLSGADIGTAGPMVFGAGQPPGGLEPGAFGTIRLASVAGWLLVGTLSVALLTALVRRPGRRLGVPAAAAVVLVFFDLARAGMGYNPAIDRDIATQPATGAIRYLQRQRPARFVSVGAIPQDYIPMTFDLEEARGYDLPIDARYDRLWRREVSPEFPEQVGPYPLNIPLSLPKVDARRLRTLSLLGVGDVLQPLGDPVLRVPGLKLAYAGPDARVYSNANALPRTWVAGAQRVIAGDEEGVLDAITAPGFDALGQAVTEEAVPGLPRGGPRRAGEARLVVHDPERVEIRATARREGLVVLDDLYDPGWKATVDGEEAEVYRVDAVFRGVRVPPGEHTVVMTYEPLGWRLGRITSLTALAGLAVTVALGLRRRRRTP